MRIEIPIFDGANTTGINLETLGDDGVRIETRGFNGGKSIITLQAEDKAQLIKALEIV